MNEPFDPPAERDLPPARAARIRAGLLAEAREPRRRVPRRLLVAAAAVLTLVAAVTVTPEVRRDDRTQILAMSPDELDSSLRRAAEQCLEWMDPDRYPEAPGPDFVPVSLADVTLASRQGSWIGVLFFTDVGYSACDVQMAGGHEVSGGVGSEVWPHRDWLPGPVQRLSLSSTEIDGGSVAVLGRVSARVDRLVLEHGNGRTTTARLREGAFGVMSRTDDVRKNAQLVSYDGAGREIDRRNLFQPSDQYDHCYTDPAGTVLYGTPGPGCLPADRWRP